MPYILPIQRADYAEINNVKPHSPGDLNYCITMLCINFMSLGTESYANYNAVIGALECAKLELHRRVIIPHEDTKIEANGDVY